MANLSSGGVPLPLDEASDERVLDPANAGIAVQNHGYWASGYLTIARSPSAAHARARDALAAARGGAQLPAGVVARSCGAKRHDVGVPPLNEGRWLRTNRKTRVSGHWQYMKIR